MMFKILVLFILILLIGCTKYPDYPTNFAKEKVLVSVKLVVNGETVFSESKEVPKGTNALSALNEFMEVKYKDYFLGVFVEELNGIKPEKGMYWALYVNGEYADKGITGFELNSDTEIEWRLEEIKR